MFTVAQGLLISNTFTAFIGGQYFTFTFYNMAVLFDNEFWELFTTRNCLTASLVLVVYKVGLRLFYVNRV